MEKKSNNNSVKRTGSNVTRKSTTNKNAKGKKKHPRLKKVIIIFALLIVLLVLVAVGIFCGIFFSDKFALSKDDLLLSNANTVIYDKDGTVIAELSGNENRKIISIGDMCQYLPKAFVAIEDERFYSHNGVDLKRTLAATTTYVLKGDSSFGGSTITQQLIKNITDERENSGKAGVERKIKEMSRAYQVEKMISKDQILELYLNIIPLGADGGDICGVEMASTYYFNKSASELSVEECAFLAGINNAPNTYNPFKNESDATKQEQVNKKIKDRTKTVLTKMKDLGYITDEQYKTAYDNVEKGLQFSKGTLPGSSVKSYFIQAAIDEVVNDLVNEKNYSVEYAKNRVYGGGYKIYTTQDSTIQSEMEDIYRNSDEHIFVGVATDKEGNKLNDHTQSAMVVIDHKTGRVVGCMGGLGDDVDSNGQNRATQSTRQPGSAIKPLAAIAPALESGIITAATVYDESRTTFSGGYTPNPHRGYSLVTVRQGIGFSANTMSVKIMAEVGPSNSIAFLKKFGISTLVTASENSEKNDENLSLVLGGATNGITPLEMAGAYATIANDGVYITPTFYTRVEDKDGNTVMEPTQETRRVLSEGNAYILKSILTGPIIGNDPTAPYCKISGQDVGGKTGTTTNNYDRWFCGFTNYYTAATWYGFDQPENLYPAKANGTNRAARLWVAVMKKVHSDLPSSKFEKPSKTIR